MGRTRLRSIVLEVYNRRLTFHSSTCAVISGKEKFVFQSTERVLVLGFASLFSALFLAFDAAAFDEKIMSMTEWQVIKGSCAVSATEVYSRLGNSSSWKVEDQLWDKDCVKAKNQGRQIFPGSRF